MEGFKECPECGCTDVPVSALICPFCGHPLEVPSFAAEEPELGGIPDSVWENTGFLLVDEEQPYGGGPECRATGEPVRGKSRPVEAADRTGNRDGQCPGASADARTENFAMQPYENQVPVPRYDAGTGSAADKTSKKTKKRRRHGFRGFALVAAAVCAIFLYDKVMEYFSTGGISDGDAVGADSRKVSYAYQESMSQSGGESLTEGDGMSGGESSQVEGSRELPAYQEEDNGQFILPLSDQVYLTREDIEGLSAEELRVARNEIYARHGRLFRDEGLQAYFNGCAWYTGSIPADDFSDEVFNEYERANKDLIVSYEHELGVNGQ